MTLPTPGSDDNSWGTILNNFLLVSHNNDGSLRDTALNDAEVVQSSDIRRIVRITQAEYDELTPAEDTLYVIID